MKKHFKAYLSGKVLAATDVSSFNGVSKLRARLMEAENAFQAEQIINNYLKNLFK